MICAQGLLHDRRGVAALELALTAPLMLIMFFGVVEVTQLIRVNNKLTYASQAIANIVAGQSSATVTSVTNAYQGGELVMAPFVTTTTPLAVAIASVTFDSSGNASTLAWQVDLGGASALTVAAACSLASGLGLSNDSVIIVQASYSYSAITHYILPASYALSHNGYGRPRNEATISGTSSPSTAPSGSC